MSDWYELIGQTPVRIDGDILECARRMETLDRRVAETNVLGICRVSTIFLGLDHSYFGGPPLLFETMAFWRGEHGAAQMRCSTWPEAEAQHARMCAEVPRPGAILAFVRRYCADWWYQARRDARRRWRELRGIELTEHEKTLDAIETRLYDMPEEW